MIITDLKRDRAYKPRRYPNYNIIAFGERNDLPQVVQKIVGQSPTAMNCIEIFKSFLFKGGFEDETISELEINSHGDTMNDLLYQMASDYALFGSFAIQIDSDELCSVPFEYVRIGMPDENFQVNFYAIYNDWTNEKLTKKEGSHPEGKEDIDYIHAFTNNSLEQIQQRNATSYKGMLYYHSPHSMTQYPLPIYYPALTDISTEGGLCNLCYRNARMNFFPAGMVTMVDTTSKNDLEQRNFQAEITSLFTQFQGDSDAGKLLFVPVNDPANVPQFIPIQANNLDSQFTQTNASVKDRIGRIFNQPPILRSEDVGSNFGADAIGNAYQFYNSIVAYHRQQLEMALQKVTQAIGMNIEIKLLPCEYIKSDDIRKFDNEEITTIMLILSSPSLVPETKAGMLKMAYGLTDEEIALLLPPEQVEQDVLEDNQRLEDGSGSDMDDSERPPKRGEQQSVSSNGKGQQQQGSTGSGE